MGGNRRESAVGKLVNYFYRRPIKTEGTVRTRGAMDKPTAKRRPARLRSVRAYLLGMLALTLLLFSETLASLVKNQSTVRELSLSHLRLGGERIAVELENRLQTLATDCLRGDRFKGLPFNSGGELSLDQAQLLRRKFDELKKESPVAAHFFLVSDGRLAYPRLRAPQPEKLHDMVSAAGSTAAREFETLVLSGIDAEERLRQPRSAYALYRRAEALTVPGRLKALASYRAARLDSHGSTSSVQAYRKHLELYGDEYNELREPYTLALTSLPESLVPGVYKSRTFSAAYADLLRGRWELSADQADHYVTRLEARLGVGPDARPKSDFLEHFALGRAVRAEPRAGGLLEPEVVVRRALRLKNSAFQTYSTSPAGIGGQKTVVGFSVSMPWVQSALLPGLSVEVLGRMSFVPLLEATPLDGSEKDIGSDVCVSFKNTLPFWRLRIPAPMVQTSESAADREIWFLGLSSGMFLSVLGLEIYLLIVVSRDMHSYQLRADFLGGVSHELKTPLSLIRLYSETLADSEQSYTPEERRDYVRIIARESQRLSYMIDNILNFSQFERGGRHYLTEEGDLAAAVGQTVEDYSDYLAMRGFSVKAGIQSGLPPVRFNKEQVSQAVLNLMENARKYSGESRVIRVNMWLQGNDVVVEVQDRGIGIPADQQEKIFEPFYRLPVATEKGGCGLGLYLVHQVMQGHGGRVEVESQVGKGSRFRLYFPIAGAPAKRDRRSEKLQGLRDREFGHVES
jgi:signal transduction histidine kinase